jgi:hypothetical protein
LRWLDVRSAVGAATAAATTAVAVAEAIARREPRAPLLRVAAALF